MDCTPILDAIARRVPRDGNTYTGPDGLQHCCQCHTPREVVLELPGMGRRIMPCLCRCKARERDLEYQRLKDQERMDRLRRLRTQGFRDQAMADATFALDDRKNPKISDALVRYADSFPEFRREGKGLLLYGPVGTGKSYYAACVVNALIDRGYPALMTAFPRLINQIGGAPWEQRQSIIDQLGSYALVVLDDLGAERQTDYAVEQMTAVIDTLYRAGVCLVVTTNLNPSQCANHADTRIRRIWDRIMERCHPIAVLGESRRREKGQADFARTRELLGI